MIKSTLLFLIFFFLLNLSLNVQTEQFIEWNVDDLPVREYTLEINEEIVNKVG
jgi:ATP/maltotriose-dependent transcriptional regulator MalT